MRRDISSSEEESYDSSSSEEKVKRSRTPKFDNDEDRRDSILASKRRYYYKNTYGYSHPGSGEQQFMLDRVYKLSNGKLKEVYRPLNSNTGLKKKVLPKNLDDAIPEEIKKFCLYNSKTKKYEQIPDESIRILYVSGPSGSGKSTYASSYISKYKKINPDCRFYMFSELSTDPVLDKLNPKRITIDIRLVEQPVEIDMIEEGSIVLFDDCDSNSNKKIQDAINNIKTKVLELGRKKRIQIVITSHLINGNSRNISRTIMNELNSFTFFPLSTSHHQLKYALKNHFGLTDKQINTIKQINSRWITLIKSYPSVLIAENTVMFLNEIV